VGIFIKDKWSCIVQIPFSSRDLVWSVGVTARTFVSFFVLHCILTQFDDFAHFWVAVVDVQGSHDELMARKKVYFDLLSSQGQLNDTGSAAPSRMSAANTGVNTGSNTPRPE